MAADSFLSVALVELKKSFVEVFWGKFFLNSGGINQLDEWSGTRQCQEKIQHKYCWFS